MCLSCYHTSSSPAVAAEVLFFEFPAAAGQFPSTPAAVYRSLAWTPEVSLDVGSVCRGFLLHERMFIPFQKDVYQWNGKGCFSMEHRNII